MLKPDLFQTWSKGLPMPGFLLFLTSYPDDLWLHTQTHQQHTNFSITTGCCF